jgi:outer membrane protein assembly factor BamB
MKILQNRSLKNKFVFLLAFILLILITPYIFAQENKVTDILHEEQKGLNFPFENCWSLSTKNSISNLIASDNEYVYLTTDPSEFRSSELVSINSNGKIQWKTDIGGQVTSNLLLKGDNIFLASRSVTDKTVQSGGHSAQQIKPVNMLRAVNRVTGVTNWLVKTFDSEKIYLYNFQDSIILIGEEGGIKSVNMSTNEIVWENTLGGKLSSQPFIEHEQAVAGRMDGYIITWSLSDGRQISKLKVSTMPTAIVMNTQSRNLFWGNAIGSVFSVKNTNAAKPLKNYKIDWRFRNGAKISHLTLTSDGLLVSSDDNFVYFISYENGETIWKKRFAGRISSEPFIVGKFALVMTAAESDVSVIEMSSGKTVNRISLQNGNGFTNNPIKIGQQIIFPTFDGAFSFSHNGCSKN